MKTYTSYRRYSAEFDDTTGVIQIRFAGYEGYFTFSLEKGIYNGKTYFTAADYGYVQADVQTEMDRQILRISYQKGPVDQEQFKFLISLTKGGVHCRMDVMGHYKVFLKGVFSFGKGGGRPVSIDRRGMDLRSAYGPAVSLCDNALFDVKSDAAVEIRGIDLCMKYDWDKKHFSHSICTAGDDVQRDFTMKLHEHLFERKFGVPYAPINKNTCFPTPPVGWMTWYAVQFDACEEAVLHNARQQKELLGPYGANAIWVDWEWYHQNFSGQGKPGTDIFNPDPERYPHGLAYVADKISELGFTPCLWIGATNDPNKNEFFSENPDTVLVCKRSWCGQYFIDPTHPKIKDEYIPRVFRSIVNDGYKALKWDCFPVSFLRTDENHDKLFDPEVSTDEAMRELVKIARNVVGKDFYMLSCSGETDRDILFAGDIFDAARIGGDIFRWKEFVANGVDRVLRYYHFHNTLFYADPDNVVIRQKYSNMDQAISRVSMVSILGLPLTIGDRFDDLDSQRIQLLQHSIPILDIHPMDIRQNIGNERLLLMNLAIATPYEDWNVIDVLNLTECTNHVRVSLSKDIHVETGGDTRYLLFDYWNRKYLGEIEDTFDLELAPYASSVIGIRKKTGLPQLLSTTRHISQGALEIQHLEYDAKKRVLSGISSVVAGDEYALYVYVPEGLRIFHEGNYTSIFDIERVDVVEEIGPSMQCPNGSVWKVNIRSDANEDVPWSLAFMGCNGLGND